MRPCCCSLPTGGEKHLEMTGFCFIRISFVSNVLHMDIRREDRVLHITSGLKPQWQFSPWITSHRFQLPLRWYARVRLIRYTFMSSATKHLASQRCSSVAEHDQATGSLAKCLLSILTTAAARHLMFCGGRGVSRHPQGKLWPWGGDRSFFFFSLVSWQLLLTLRCSKPRWLRFLPLWAEARRRGRGKEAIIQERRSNLVMSCGDKWRISHLNHNLDCLPRSRHPFPICPADFWCCYRLDNLLIWYRQLDSITTISNHLSASAFNSFVNIIHSSRQRKAFIFLVVRYLWGVKLLVYSIIPLSGVQL